MTHCAGYRGAAVARISDLAAIGIDAEENRALPTDIADSIASPTEWDHLDKLPIGEHWDTLLFSAKESIFKLWFQWTSEPLGFRSTSVAFVPSATSHRFGDISAHVEGPSVIPGSHELRGKYKIRGGLVLTAFSIDGSKRAREI